MKLSVAILSLAILSGGNASFAQTDKQDKKAKAYMQGVFEVEVQSITTAGSQTLVLDQTDAEFLKGKRVLIIDDVISTGESLRAMEVLCEKAGAVVAGRMAVLAEGDAYDREDITVLTPLPLFRADGTPLQA